MRPRAASAFVLCFVAVCAAALAPRADAGRRVSDRNGVVFREVDGALRFHPLLSFQALNAQLDSGRRVRASRLARALLARARRNGRTLVWDYRFEHAGHAAPWRSGMAQAVAAEALARAGYRRAARQAFGALGHGLVARAHGATWIRLYSFSPIVVLNAQLQSAVSLRRYAALTGDRRAGRLAARLLAGADRLYPRFETACWSRYALDGTESTPLYHRYVGELAMRIARETRARSWRERAARLYATLHRPALAAGRAAGTVYPVPADGFRDSATLSFWLSKCSWVTLRVGSRETRAWYPPGRHRLVWRPRGVPGDYRVRVSAVDAEGRRAAIELPKLVVRRDRRAPRVSLAVAGPRLRWHARDAGTPWLRFALVLRAGGDRVVFPLGRHAHRGLLTLSPPWRGNGVLLVSDSSGNTRRVRLGAIGVLGKLGRRPAAQL